MWYFGLIYKLYLPIVSTVNKLKFSDGRLYLSRVWCRSLLLLLLDHFIYKLMPLLWVNRCPSLREFQTALATIRWELLVRYCLLTSLEDHRQQFCFWPSHEASRKLPRKCLTYAGFSCSWIHFNYKMHNNFRRYTYTSGNISCTDFSNSFTFNDGSATWALMPSAKYV